LASGILSAQASWRCSARDSAGSSVGAPGAGLFHQTGRGEGAASLGWGSAGSGGGSAS